MKRKRENERRKDGRYVEWREEGTETEENKCKKKGGRETAIKKLRRSEYGRKRKRKGSCGVKVKGDGIQKSGMREKDE